MGGGGGKGVWGGFFGCREGVARIAVGKREQSSRDWKDAPLFAIKTEDALPDQGAGFIRDSSVYRTVYFWSKLAWHVWFAILEIPSSKKKHGTPNATWSLCLVFAFRLVQICVQDNANKKYMSSRALAAFFDLHFSLLFLDGRIFGAVTSPSGRA